MAVNPNSISLYESEGFLSCLHGSEQNPFNVTDITFFLSCLHGSEHAFLVVAGLSSFLSCLHGSELMDSKVAISKAFSKLPTWQ